MPHFTNSDYIEAYQHNNKILVKAIFVKSFNMQFTWQSNTVEDIIMNRFFLY